MDTQVLIVEDSSIVALDIKRCLISLGYKVCAAVPSGEEAILMAGQYQPDLILMDIMLRGKLDGIEAAEKVRALYDIPIIFLTAYSDETTLNRAKLTKPFGYLVKPFEDRVLHTTIELALYKYQMEKKLQESEEWLATTLQSIGDGIIATDAVGNIRLFNSVAEKLTGWLQAEAVGHQLREIFTISDSEPNIASQGMISENTVHLTPNQQTILRTKDGQILPIEQSIAPIRDNNGQITGVVLVFRNISDRKRMEEQLRYLSFHDSLTGLFNRTFFEREMSSANEGNMAPIGLVLCDLDGLKLVNDTLGHERGDRLLIETAKLLDEQVRGFQNGFAARIGGDEFAILLKNTTMSDLTELVTNIRKAVSGYNDSNTKLPLSISVGYSLSAESAIKPLVLFKEADDYMYREKLYRSQSTRSTIVQALMKVLETKDFVTEGHVMRLEMLITSFVQDIGLPEQMIINLRLLAQFHDIGKVGTPDRVLFKPGPLNAEEQLEMERHSEIGHRIAQSIPDLIPIADLILKHHEWWNGKGYPLGLQGESIPLECRILAIADAYDAMTSDRPYRKAMTEEAALAELANNAGIQFDPQLIKEFTERKKRKHDQISMVRQ